MRFSMFSLLVVSIVFASAQSSGQEPAAVNSKASGFTLQDQSGKPRALDELRKNRNVALVFYRSADW
ncbi:MAG: hypothetical protein O3C40_09675 [Planctomycetota bacterium]|nr:hypothetical protein [Planctomycetota bacterium]